MPNLFITAVLTLAAGALAVPAMAQTDAPDGYETFWDEPTRVNLAGRPVLADIALHFHQSKIERDDLDIALTTDVTKFVVETERDLENWINARRERCGERWGAENAEISFPDGNIRFQMKIIFEYYQCGLRGNADPSAIAHESGQIDVVLEPYVENGKLQAQLGKLEINNRKGVSRVLPLEFALKRVVDSELKKLNDNPKFYRAPEPLFSENLVYESINGEVTNDDRIVITAHYVGDGDEAALVRIMRGLREDGVTQ